MSSFQFFLIFGDSLEFVFHRGGKADIHDHLEIVFEHLSDDFAEFGGFECPFLFDGVVAALDFVHDRRIGRRAADARFLELFDEGGFGEARRRAVKACSISLRGAERLAFSRGGKQFFLLFFLFLLRCL